MHDFSLVKQIGTPKWKTEVWSTPGKKISGLSHFGLGMGWGWLGGHCSCLAHVLGINMDPFFKNEKLKESFNILSLKHGSNILKQWGSKITILVHGFFWGKIGLQDSGLRGFGWALGCGRTIKNFILKKNCLCWDRIQAFISESWKFHIKTILILEHMHFFWWCSALRVSFSIFIFWKF